MNVSIASGRQPAFGGGCKIEDAFEFVGVRRRMLGKFFQSLGTVESLTEKNAVNLLHAFDLFEREALALQSYFVEGANDGRLAISDEKGGNVLHHLRVSADHRISADPTELMHAGDASDGDVIFDPDVSRQRDRIAHHDVVGQVAVVGHVTVGENDVVVADDREFSVVSRRVD